MSRCGLIGTLAIALPVVASGLTDGRIGWPSIGLAHAGEAQAGFVTIASDELAQMLAHKDFYFVNVHIPYEGEIALTDAFIAFDNIAENLDRLPHDRAAPIVLYCRSGRMSEIAAGELAGRGFTQVSHLAGGMVDWQRSGHPVLQRSMP
jgi:rhodanese-related sulfurtransferase